ncbi:liprin-beta-1-like isoform X4 [Antedon mediterranea]|uniref:liprin-beta-1-like isoform X4 n=1 Tax=Antedon mediterranea TaxID=105859 RepID=UPI003AF9C59F
MTTSLGTDASEMLAAALEQMDDIIAGSSLSNMEYNNGVYEVNTSANSKFMPYRPAAPNKNIVGLCEELRLALEKTGDGFDEWSLKEQVPDKTRAVILNWIQGHNKQTNGIKDTQDQIRKLEAGKESLLLQVAVLTDQVEVQSEKINELEFTLSEENKLVAQKESQMKEEMSLRHSLESHKLDLIAEITSLKLQLNGAKQELTEWKEKAIESKSSRMEKENESIQEKYKSAQLNINDLHTEANEWQEKYMISQVKLVRTQKDASEFRTRSVQAYNEIKNLEAKLNGLRDTDTEAIKLKKAVESLMSANEEKEMKIEELRQSINSYKRIQQEMVLTTQGSQKGLDLQEEEELQLDSSPSVSSAGNLDQDETIRDQERHQATLHINLAGPSATSTPINAPIPPPVSDDGLLRPRTLDIISQEEEYGQQVRSSSMDNMKRPHHLSNNYSAAGVYSTLPSPKTRNFLDVHHSEPTTPERMKRNKTRVSFGKGIFKRNTNKMQSAPNLTNNISEENLYRINGGRYVNYEMMQRGELPPPPGTPPTEIRKKKKGIKKLFVRLKRSGSTQIASDDEEAPMGFQRGGRLRATAGARLGWSRDIKSNGHVQSAATWDGKYDFTLSDFSKVGPWLRRLELKQDIDMPFAKWDTDQVAAWLHELGLSQYVSMCRVSVKNGATLLEASPQTLYSELGVKNPLHRKKLLLALQAISKNEKDKMGELDYTWVTRWLDDIGLPQYKDSFHEARVDGRMLNFLTVDDLLSLKVTSALHHISIMRGIQCLRLNHFNPNCLRRRPTDEVWPIMMEPYESGAEVMLWSNHRVMEWLRSVDLAEYAPNLRGSGVHGALMVLEPRFLADTLAALLCIPPTKTLLRRHLNTHFVSLVTSECQAEKREIERLPTFVPLNSLAKIKPKKRAFTRKKRGGEDEDYLCPFDTPLPSSMKLDGVINGASTTNKVPSYLTEVRSTDMVHKQRDEINQAEDNRRKPTRVQSLYTRRDVYNPRVYVHPRSAVITKHNQTRNGNAHGGATPIDNFGAFSQEINSLTSMLSRENFKSDEGTNV